MWRSNDEVGNTEERNTTIKRLKGFLVLPSLAPKLQAPLHCPFHRKLCGALPSGPFSISLLFFFCFWFLHSVCRLSYPVLYLSRSLISYLTISLRSLRVPSSLTLSFPVLSLIHNSTSCHSSLSVLHLLMSLFLQLFNKSLWLSVIGIRCTLRMKLVISKLGH